MYSRCFTLIWAFRSSPPIIRDVNKIKVAPVYQQVLMSSSPNNPGEYENKDFFTTTSTRNDNNEGRTYN